MHIVRKKQVLPEWGRARRRKKELFIRELWKDWKC